MKYQRAFTPGGPFFFTLVTEGLRPLGDLREAEALSGYATLTRLTIAALACFLAIESNGCILGETPCTNHRTVKPEATRDNPKKPRRSSTNFCCKYWIFSPLRLSIAVSW